MITVIPMAGAGERFRRDGYTIPKPLIPVNGLPMFVRAARSLPLAESSAVVFAIQRKDDREFGISTEISRWFSNFNTRIVLLDGMTAGQASTVLFAVRDVPDGESILIFNADSSFEDDLAAYLKELPDDVAGCVQVFRDGSPRWSFAEVDNALRVKRTAEKVPISDWACTGSYFFKTLQLYRECYAAQVFEAGERYIAPMYNHLIRNGYKVMAKPVGRYYCFGTPEDLREHQAGKVYTGK